LVSGTRETPRRRPPATLVVALVALSAALAGSAVALPGKGSVDKNDLEKNAVVSKAIKKNAVKAKHIRSGQVRADEIRDGEVGAAEIAPAEAFHRVGPGGEIQFANGGEGDCVWAPAPIGVPDVNPAGFYRDQLGTVHLVGFIAASDGVGGDGNCDSTDPGEAEDSVAFVLPAGYRPENLQVTASLISSSVIVPDEGALLPSGSLPAGAVASGGGSLVGLDNALFRAADAGTAPIENAAPARIESMRALRRLMR
jgi:hypothetical protein